MVSIFKRECDQLGGNHEKEFVDRNGVGFDDVTYSLWR